MTGPNRSRQCNNRLRDAKSPAPTPLLAGSGSLYGGLCAERFIRRAPVGDNSRVIDILGVAEPLSLPAPGPSL
jgi:hypothetical protein